jgi:hypothetical protein
VAGREGTLAQVKLGKDVIYDKPDIAPPTASLTLAQQGPGVKKQKIAGGTERVLTLVFEKNADIDTTHYAGTISTGAITPTILP